jgi:hypothetical protein
MIAGLSSFIFYLNLRLGGATDSIFKVARSAFFFTCRRAFRFGIGIASDFVCLDFALRCRTLDAIVAHASIPSLQLSMEPAIAAHFVRGTRFCQSNDTTRQFGERSAAVVVTQIVLAVANYSTAGSCADIKHCALSLQETGARYDKDKEKVAPSAEIQPGA